MTDFNGQQSLTVGQTYTGQNSLGTWPYDQNYIYPSVYIYPNWGMNYWRVDSEPQSCIGKAHVFECDHERKCKCGKVARVMPKAKKA